MAAGDVCWTQRRCKTNAGLVALIFSAAAVQDVIAFLKSSATVQPATRRYFQEKIYSKKWREFLSWKRFCLLFMRWNGSSCCSWKWRNTRYRLRYLEGHLARVVLSTRVLKRSSKSASARVGQQQTRSISTVFCVTSVFGRDSQIQFCQKSVPKIIAKNFSEKDILKSLIFAFFLILQQAVF